MKKNDDKRTKSDKEINKSILRFLAGLTAIYGITLSLTITAFALTKQGLPFKIDRVKKTGYTTTIGNGFKEVSSSYYAEPYIRNNEKKTIIVVYDKPLSSGENCNALEYDLTYMGDEEYKAFVSIILSSNVNDVVLYLQKANEFTVKSIYINIPELADSEISILSKTTEKNGTSSMEIETKENNESITVSILGITAISGTTIIALLPESSEHKKNKSKLKN